MLPISLRVTSLALGQSYDALPWGIWVDRPHESMGTSQWIQLIYYPNYFTINPCAYFMADWVIGFNVFILFSNAIYDSPQTMLVPHFKYIVCNGCLRGFRAYPRVFQYRLTIYLFDRFNLITDCIYLSAVTVCSLIIASLFSLCLVFAVQLGLIPLVICVCNCAGVILQTNIILAWTGAVVL